MPEFHYSGLENLNLFDCANVNSGKITISGLPISKFDFNAGTEIEKVAPRGIRHSKMPSAHYDHRTKNNVKKIQDSYSNTMEFIF